MRPRKAEEIEALRREAQRLAAVADALGEAYRRRTWIRFTAVFFPIPFVVVLLRLQLEAWHYYVAGGAYLLFSMVLFEIDTRLSRKCDEAVRAAGRARQAYELASWVPPG